MLTVLTILGLQAGVLLGGAVIVESIFGVPGLGLMAQQAVIARDFQTLQAVTVLFALWFISVQLLVDISYAWVDPRIRYS
jgi:ABC-type dipeptide/oligopeptide/nickel transport system permease component